MLVVLLCAPTYVTSKIVMLVPCRLLGRSVGVACFR